MRWNLAGGVQLFIVTFFSFLPCCCCCWRPCCRLYFCSCGRLPVILQLCRPCRGCILLYRLYRGLKYYSVCRSFCFNPLQVLYNAVDVFLLLLQTKPETVFLQILYVGHTVYCIVEACINHVVHSFGICKHKVHRMAKAIFWRTFHHAGKISPGWVGDARHAHPLSLYLYHHAQSRVVIYAPAERAHTLLCC